jgi:iron complex transport system permease protein
VWLLIVAVVTLACLCVGVGEGRGIALGWPGREIFEIRALRVLPAGVVGLALAGAGVTLQALLRNPLADPYVLGISSGSSVGVMVWLLLTGPLWTLAAKSSWLFKTILVQGQAVPALLGAVATCAIVYVMAWPRRRDGGGADPLTLLLVGVVISAVNGAVLTVLNSLVPAGVRTNFFNYMTGAISNDVTWLGLAVALGVFAIGYVPIAASGAALNVGSLSDVEATSLGVNVGRLRTVCFVCASVMTAAAILLAGPVGFVGLICPHICRGIVGADHRRLVVAAPLCGAAFLMITDTFVRVTGGIFHGELAVGVVTALLGGPFFLVLLKRRPVWGGV